MKPEIKQFWKSDKTILEFTYNGSRLNARNLLKELRNPSLVAVRFIIFRIAMIIPSSPFKRELYRIFGGMKIGKEVVISDGVYIDPYFPELISIDDGTIIGSDSKILTHEAGIKHVRLGKVKIGKQVLIGANSLIRGGVAISDKSTVAMDSLVNKNVRKNELVGGIPEHKIKRQKKLY